MSIAPWSPHINLPLDLSKLFQTPKELQEFVSALSEGFLSERESEELLDAVSQFG